MKHLYLGIVGVFDRIAGQRQCRYISTKQSVLPIAIDISSSRSENFERLKTGGIFLVGTNFNVTTECIFCMLGDPKNCLHLCSTYLKQIDRAVGARSPPWGLLGKS